MAPQAETGAGRPVGEDGPASRPGGVADLEAAWAALAAERREVERLRRDLLSTVSHELRTPLTLIRTSIGLLLESRPELDGFETLRRIREFSDVPVIMLTARDSVVDKVKGLELGADSWTLRTTS